MGGRRAGRHPAEHGWGDITNLLWGLAHGQISPREVLDNLPIVHHWPPELRACIQPPDRPIAAARAKEMLTRWLVQQLYPSPPRPARLPDPAGRGDRARPEEVTTLTINDVEFLPSGVRLTMTKRRAQRVRHRTFGTAPAETAASGPVDSPTGPTTKSVRSSSD